jgi:GNAT superfamily N-acetyltransferase
MAIVTHRARTAADFEALWVLLSEYEASLPPDLRHGSVPNSTALKSIYAKRSAAFVAAAEGRIIGCVAVAELDAGTAVMMRLFVRPANRGMGAARVLVNAAMRFARRSRYGRVVLDTDKERLRAAYCLYRSLGFTECEPYAGVDYTCPTFMERSVRLV